MKTIKADECKNNFIFISYSHEDKAIVLPIIEKLQEQYYVWFDNGIRASDEYRDIIIEHIDSCAVFLFLVSSNSVKSKFCMKEIRYAESIEKPFVNIVIKDCLKDKEAKSFMFDYEAYQMINLYRMDMNTFMRELPYEIPPVNKCVRYMRAPRSPEPVQTPSKQEFKPVPEPVSKPKPKTVEEMRREMLLEGFEKYKENAAKGTIEPLPAPSYPWPMRASAKAKEINEVLAKYQLNIKCVTWVIEKRTTTFKFECSQSFTKEDFEKVLRLLMLNLELPDARIVSVKVASSTKYFNYGIIINNSCL